MTAPPTLGLMLPESNTTMEREMRAALPPGTRLRRVGVPNGSGPLSLATLPAYQEAALRLAAGFGAIDLLVYGCTAAGFLAGPEGDAAFGAALGRAVGCPVVTAAGAMVAALHRDDAREIAVVTPYLEAANRQMEEFLAAAGIRVARLASFRAPDIAALCAITAAEVEALARATMGPDVDALFVGCTQLPTQGVLERLAAHSGRPAWSSVSATCRATAQALHLEPA